MVHERTGTTYIKTGKSEFDDFYPIIKSFLEKDTLDVIIDGKKIRGYRSPDARSIWIRDYSEMFRGFRYFEKDLKSTIEHFAEMQSANGMILDYFTTFPEKLPSERENWTKYVRVPVEADVEFRFVKAAYLAWQSLGDDTWIERLLPNLEKALNYVLSHSWRWEGKLGLVKRAYTIDTWDFAYTAGKHDWLQFQIDEDTFWGIMHGDNSGYYEAFKIMAFFYDYFGNTNKAEQWENRAATLREAMNSVCWNGSFYTHFVKLTPVEIPGVDEASQLSLSNPADINRGAATHEMAVSIIREYQRRRDQADAFAEWFSIDPPFPRGVFGDEKLVSGAYINGGIMPLVGGELARAAFEHGFESYGVDILNRYYQMISEKRETYLWYFPDGSASTVETSTSPDATPTDGWGSSAMLYAFIEGLAGVEDRLSRFKKIKLSPRWLAADVHQAEVKIGYEVSQSAVSYQYRHRGDQIDLTVENPGAEIWFHVLIPQNKIAGSVTVDQQQVEFENIKIEKSHYVDFNTNLKSKTKIKIELKSK